MARTYFGEWSNFFGDHTERTFQTRELAEAALEYLIEKGVCPESNERPEEVSEDDSGTTTIIRTERLQIEVGFGDGE